MQFSPVSPRLPFLCAEFAVHPSAVVNHGQEDAQRLSVVSPNESEEPGS